MYSKLLLIAASIFTTLSLCRADDVIIPMDPWPPWKLVDTQTWMVDSGGVDNRLIEALLATYNQTFGVDLQASYRGYPWKRALDMMEKGNADLISGILKSPERERYLIFLEPPYKTKSAKIFYVRKGEQQRIQEYEDLYQLKIGVQAGVRYFAPFDDDPKIRKEEAGDDLSNLRKLQHGRLDAVISTETQADYWIATQSLEDQFDKASYRYDYDLPVYFALSRQSSLAQHSAQFSRVIAELSDKGVFEKVIADYFRDLARQ
jgi:polar amino acid transport system substrate-binding protein